MVTSDAMIAFEDFLSNVVHHSAWLIDQGRAKEAQATLTRAWLDHVQKGGTTTQFRIRALEQKMESLVDSRKFRGLQHEIHAISVDHGWWKDGPEDLGFKLALIHSEVSEAVEEYRDGHELTDVYYRDGSRKPCGFPTELADVVIRSLDLADGLGIDLEEVIRVKMEYNKTRPWRHGGKKA